ncbi:MAG: hypothetical protein IJA59_02615 [Clostridia bacterium]|nr:hypothetical protein [Clostridia bacterium]
MALFDRRAVKAAAGDSLAKAQKDPKRPILIHTGATLLLAIVLTVIDYLLDRVEGRYNGPPRITEKDGRELIVRGSTAKKE